MSKEKEETEDEFVGVRERYQGSDIVEGRAFVAGPCQRMETE